MNKELNKLYSSKWPEFSKAINNVFENKEFEIKPTNPLLLCIDEEEEFSRADIRLMIYGQETNNWFDKPKNSIEEIQENYNSFFNEGDCWRYGGQFWRGVERFKTSLQEKYQDKSIRLVWNNIIKVGKLQEKGAPPDYIYEIERNHFDVIANELEIIKPNIVLFLTGPNYDNRIKDNFDKLKYTALPYSDERQLSRLSLNEIRFAYRTYHPNFLWRNDIDDYFDTIIEDITL